MTPVMLRTEGLAKGFTLHLRGGVRIPVLADVDLDVHAGECVVLSGPSGAGKSTLMRSLYGNYRAESGRILVRHHGEMVDIATADPRTILAVRRETLGYVSQFLRVVPRVPALDIVAEVLIGARRAQSEAARQRARRSAAAAEHPAPAACAPAGDLLRRRAAAGEPGARLHRGLSGPAAGRTDRVAWMPRTGTSSCRMIQEAKARGTAIVAICHDADVRDAIADRLFPLTPAAGRRMNNETILTNAVLVLPDEALRGTVVMRDGEIVGCAARPFGAAGRARPGRRLPDSRRRRCAHRQSGTPGAAAHAGALAVALGDGGA